MIVLLPKTSIDFVSMRYRLFAVSGFFILLGLASIIYHRGLNLGIDFTGGTVVQVGFSKTATIAEVRSVLNGAGISAEIQSFTG
ncbi:MAG: protein translocase subunit SecF, partial [bacterium]